MANNLGNDIILNNGDIDFNDNGDILTTSDIEQKMGSELPFEGYVCLRESILDIVNGIKGTYPFDVQFGSDIDLYISRDIQETYLHIKSVLERELRKDDRIQEVVSINFRQVTERIINIYVKILPIGREQSSQFVYPYNI